MTLLSNEYTVHEVTVKMTPISQCNGKTTYESSVYSENGNLIFSGVIKCASTKTTAIEEEIEALTQVLQCAVNAIGQADEWEYLFRWKNSLQVAMIGFYAQDLRDALEEGLFANPDYEKQPINAVIEWVLEELNALYYAT